MELIKKLMGLALDLQMYAANSGVEASNANVNVTTQTGSGQDVSPTMKIFYDTTLLENARNEHYFMQLGKKQRLPRNHGRTVEWRKFNTFAPALTPLTEGVTPDGNKVGMTRIEARIYQYGDYTTISDLLELEALDPVIAETTKEHGAQAGETLDLLTRNEVITGTNVIYGGGKTTRSALTSADILTPTIINQARTFLVKMKAPTWNGKYVALIHPSVSYDVRQSSEWIEVHKYAAVTPIFTGEIGELHGVRFIESNNVKIWNIGTGGTKNCVYGCMFFGKDAFAVIDPSAENMEVIVKQRGSSGTADPLNQRSTTGWKASTGAKILYEERMVRVEVGSFYSDTDDEN